MCQQRVNDIRKEKWENVCKHVEEKEKEGIIENVIENFVIQVSDDINTETSSDSANSGMSGVEYFSDV